MGFATAWLDGMPTLPAARLCESVDPTAFIVTLTPQLSRSWRFFADTLVYRREEEQQRAEGQRFHDRSGRAFSRDNSEGTRDHKYALGMSTSEFDDSSLPTCSRRVFLEKTLAGIAMLNAATVTAADDLANLQLHEAATLVRQKKVSPVQLTQACIARIEALNPSLNAFITVTA